MRALLFALSALCVLLFGACIAASAWVWAYGSNDAASLVLALLSILPLGVALSTADYAYHKA